MRLDKPPLLRRQRTDPSKPSSQSGVLRVHGGHDAVCIHARRVLAVFGRFSREMLTKRPKTAILAVSLIQHTDEINSTTTNEEPFVAVFTQLHVEVAQLPPIEICYEL